ncbi:MAG: hypothetical protein RL264_532 [Bacteroidota bacterium]|jgi:geranylgeranyl diphosphate synthase type II
MQELLALSQLVEEQIKKVDFPKQPANLYDPLRYFLTLGGKRIRPVATLAAAKSFEAETEIALSTAIAIEIFHNFTLIHDDIMDNAPLRRGKITVHEKWNTNIAILSGDVLFVEAYKLLAQAPNSVLPELLNVFNRTAIQVCEGQQMDMDFESRNDVSVAEYLKMIELKTSVLLACAFEMGGIIAGADAFNRFHLYEFGLNLGLAFQIQDDYLDAFGSPEKVGKQVGGDILADKKTFLSLSAKALQSSLNEKDFHHYTTFSTPTEKVEKTKALFSALSIDKKALELKLDYERKADFHLEALTCSNKEIFIEIRNFLANREH